MSCSGTSEPSSRPLSYSNEGQFEVKGSALRSATSPASFHPGVRIEMGARPHLRALPMTSLVAPDDPALKPFQFPLNVAFDLCDVHLGLLNLNGPFR